MRPGARASGLPFSLENYNLVYMALLSLLVIGGTTYSLLHGTHRYNVLLSDLGSAAMKSGMEEKLEIASSAIVDAQRKVMNTLPNMPKTFLADRRNLINQIFTKYAWLWTTLAFIAQAATLRSKTTRPDSSIVGGSQAQRTGNEGNSKVIEKDQQRIERQQKRKDDVDLQATVMGALSISLLRFIVATLLWTFFARWFLGPPLMERVRHYTGAVCTPVHGNKNSDSSSMDINALLPSSIGAEYCYSGASLSQDSHPQLFTSFGTSNISPGILRPRWKGGHDISGHTYILILSSLYLLEEITPFLPYLLPKSLQGAIKSIIPSPLWAPVNPFSAAQQGQTIATRNLVAISAILSLLVLWAINLTITSIYFHTPQEKFSGLFVALAASLLIPKGG